MQLADVLVVRVVLHRQDRQDACVIVDDFEHTSVGAALLKLRAGGTLCDGPLGHHVASDDAVKAAVSETRCLSCRRRITSTDSGWRAV